LLATLILPPPQAKRSGGTGVMSGPRSLRGRRIDADASILAKNAEACGLGSGRSRRRSVVEGANGKDRCVGPAPLSVEILVGRCPSGTSAWR